MRGVAALVLSLLALCGVCFGAGYDVGDASGWTLGYDYQQWASSKSFQVGDAIDFQYHTGMYNVKQVTKEDYESCNADNALATFSTGLDTLTIQTPGHFYFICGIPGHCEDGMKLHINVSHGSSSQILHTSPSPQLPPTVARSRVSGLLVYWPYRPRYYPYWPYYYPPLYYPYSPYTPGPYQSGSPSGPSRADSPSQPGKQPKSAPLNCFQLWTALLLSLTAFFLF